MLAEKYGWSIEYIMGLSRRQIRHLMMGSLEIAELHEEETERKREENKKDGVNQQSNMMFKKNRKNNNDDSQNFYSLFSLPGIKMTDKAKKRFIESKNIKKE